MLNNLTRISAAALALTPALAAPAPVLAQATVPVPICMSRPGNNPGSPAFVALIPPSEQLAMTDRGFTTYACVVELAELTTYRTKVCHLANDVPMQVQAQFEQQYNVSPRALCDMANILAGA